jgi:hypothetical protein
MPATKDTGTVRLDEYVLEVDSIEDSFDVAIARHEFPYRDGALLENMGQRARRVRFRAFFLNEYYPLHIGFLNHLEKRELFDLHHPKYGPLKGMIETVSVRHDERERTAEVDISFVENLRGQSEFFVQPEIRPSLVARSEALASRTFTLAVERYALAIRFDFGSLGLPAAEAAALAEAPILPDQTILSQLPALSPLGLVYVAGIDGAVRKLEAAMADVTTPANSLIATTAFANSLPGRVIGSCARAVERYARALDKIRTTPAYFLDSLRRELDGLADGLLSIPAAVGIGGTKGASSVRSHLRVVAASVLSLEAAYAYEEDEGNRDAARQAERTSRFDARGRFSPAPAADPIMTLPEIERSLSTVRAALQASIDTDRDVTPLKEQAAVLLEHVNRIKLDRENIVTLAVSNATPLHLLCLRQGLPYAAADRVLSINRTSAPNFSKGALNVYAG